jgi:hypothetical protein
LIVDMLNPPNPVRDFVTNAVLVYTAIVAVYAFAPESFAYRNSGLDPEVLDRLLSQDFGPWIASLALGAGFAALMWRTQWGASPAAAVLLGVFVAIIAWRLVIPSTAWQGFVAAGIMGLTGAMIGRWIPAMDLYLFMGLLTSSAWLGLAADDARNLLRGLVGAASMIGIVLLILFFISGTFNQRVRKLLSRGEVDLDSGLILDSTTAMASRLERQGLQVYSVSRPRMRVRHGFQLLKLVDTDGRFYMQCSFDSKHGLQSLACWSDLPNGVLQTRSTTIVYPTDPTEIVQVMVTKSPEALISQHRRNLDLLVERGIRPQPATLQDAAHSEAMLDRRLWKHYVDRVRLGNVIGGSWLVSKSGRYVDELDSRHDLPAMLAAVS